MQFHVRALGEALQIAKRVVVLVQVDVMNLVTFRDGSVVKFPNLAMQTPLAVV